MKKSYCTQNDDDCFTCSLVSFRRDCQNKPLEATPGAQAVESVTIEPMTRQRFEHEISRERSFQGLEPDRAEYWTGYQRGLRRAFHGENFGTPAEHDLWLAAVEDTAAWFLWPEVLNTFTAFLALRVFRRFDCLGK